MFYVMYIITNQNLCRVLRQSVTQHAYVLGRVTMKLLTPAVMKTLTRLGGKPPSGQI